MHSDFKVKKQGTNSDISNSPYDIMELQDVRVKIVRRGEGTDMNDIHMTNRRIE